MCCREDRGIVTFRGETATTAADVTTEVVLGKDDDSIEEGEGLIRRNEPTKLGLFFAAVGAGDVLTGLNA